MKFAVIAIGLLLSQGSWGGESSITTIVVPGKKWSIQFAGPKLQVGKSTVPGIYYGVRDRTQVSLFVESPKCAGGDADENVYSCFTEALKKNPIVLWDTERGNTAANGIHVMYMTELKVDGKTGHAMNVNVLFVHDGQWVDFHISIASPQPSDLSELDALADSVRVIESPATQ